MNTATLEIRHVLAQWDYHRALQLYRKYGADQVTADLLSAGETSFFRLKLRRELAAIADASANQSNTASAQVEQPVAGSPYKLPFQSYPEDVQAIIRAKNQKVKEIDWLRGQLELMPSNQHRFEAAMRILDLDDEVDQHWERIRYFESYQRLPEQVRITDDIQRVLDKIETLADAFRAEANYESYVSRAKSGKMNKDKLGFYEQALAAIRERKTQLEKE